MTSEVIHARKVYHEIPFAHRAPFHDGHCRFIHGHNWTIEIEFGAPDRDENGFVVDFGKLKPFRQYLEKDFDHAFVVSEYDPMLDKFKELNDSDLFKLKVVECCSCEGLARHFYEVFSELLKDIRPDAEIVEVIVREDQNNSTVIK
tara:strand:+ start:705 stop:1142 length:438 start_codon:yes stop_codon:yes gene_type:complete